jgi:HSP20 family protein
MTLLKLKQAQGNQAFSSFGNIFDLFDNSIHAGFRTWNTPAVNIMKNKEGYELQVAAPGLKKENFKINLEGDQLIISAELKEESEDKDSTYSHREFKFNRFSRKFTLPENVKAEGVNAVYENGILKLSIPELQEEKTKNREISIS